MRLIGKPLVRGLAGFFAVLVLGAGLAAAVVLLDCSGFRRVGSSLLEVGWSGFLAIVVFHLGIVFLCGAAWFVLVPQLYRPGLRTFLLGRLVRNSSEILPLSHVGGFIMGARAASVAGLSGSMSFASTIVDITMELLAQLVYVALAVVIFAMLRPGNALIRVVTSGLAAALIVAIAFTAAQRRGFAILETIANRLTLQSAAVAADGAAAIHKCIEVIYARFSGPFSGFLLHLFCWIASAAEAWFALRLMGANPGFVAVISIEGLVCAARAAAFVVPSALGVQEGAYVVLGGLYGISPGTALALSLIKRARDLALGVPSLCVWQFMEGGRIWRRFQAFSK
jgi:glycosyltransferase 2 family protein